MHAVKKGDGLEIRARRSIYKGRDILDVRLFYRPKNSDPRLDLVPTGKGIAFDIEKARAVIDAMEAELRSEPEAEKVDG